MQTDTGEKFRFEMKMSATIANVKAKIQENMDIDPDYQTLSLNGTELENDKTLRDQNIGDNATLHLSLLPPPTGKVYVSNELSRKEPGSKLYN